MIEVMTSQVEPRLKLLTPVLKQDCSQPFIHNRIKVQPSSANEKTLTDRWRQHIGKSYSTPLLVCFYVKVNALTGELIFLLLYYSHSEKESVE